MGDRKARSTIPFEDLGLVALTRKSIVSGNTDANEVEDDDPFADWDEQTPQQVATGSQPEALPTTSRTATLADPLATALLAEVARRTSTLELDPSTVEAGRRTREIDRDSLRAALRESQRTPVPTRRK